MSKTKPNNEVLGVRNTMSKTKPRLEKAVKKEIKVMLSDLNAWHFMPMQTMGQSGIPDHIACVPRIVTQSMVGKVVGMFVGIEAKALGKKPTPLQRMQLDGIEQAGGLAMYIHGVQSETGNFEETKRLLRAMFDA